MCDVVAFLRAFFKNPRGSMTVEFVALAPLLMAGFVFSFEFGRAFWAYDVITRDLRAAVRFLSRDLTSVPPYASDVCPTKAMNIAQTGSATDGTDANKHFPWKGVSATFACPSVAFAAGNYGSAGRVVTMSATVPITLSLLDFLNRLRFINTYLGQNPPPAIATGYSFTVSYQARYFGD